MFAGSIAISASIYYDKMILLTFLVPLVSLAIGSCRKISEKYLAGVLVVLFLAIVFGRSTYFIKSQSSMEFGQNSSIEGRVASFPSTKNENTGFILHVKNLGEKVQCYINISEYDVQIKKGDVIKVTGTGYAPDRKRNPGGFDYNLYLRSKGVYSVFYADSQSLKLIRRDISPLLKPVVDFRERIINEIEDKMDKRNGDFLKGLVFGIKSMDEDDSRVFTKGGISHVLAVSGLHVGFIYGFLLILASILKMSGKTSFIFVCILLLLYAFLCDFSISVARASSMAALHQLAKAYKLSYDTLNALFFIGCVNAAVNPLIVYTSSFLLSYSAVFAISVFYPFLKEVFSNLLKENWKKPMDALAITFVVQSFTFPIISYIFNGISLVSFILNLIVVPMAGFILLTFMTAMPLIAMFDVASGAVMSLFDRLAGLCFAITESFIGHGFSYVTVPTMSTSFILLYYTFLFSLAGYFYLDIRGRKAALTIWICLLWLLIVPVHFFSNNLIVTALDVGQGDSILIEAPGGENILIDGGGSYNRRIGEDVVLKALLSKNIRKLDLVICTHSHYDHIGGIIEIIDAVNIKHIMINPLEDEGFEILAERGAKAGSKIVYSKEEQKIGLSKDINMTVYYPGDNTIYLDANNSSVVLKLIYDEVSFLFTGDIEEEGERELVAMNKDLDSTILKIPHHGSNTSTTEEFLALVNPEYAIISVGRNNSYAHPSDKTLERLAGEGIKYLRTDINGAVEFVTDGEKVNIKTYIEEHP